MKNITVIDIAKKLEPDQKIDIRTRLKRKREQFHLFYGEAIEIVEDLADSCLADYYIYSIKVSPGGTLYIFVDQ